MQIGDEMKSSLPLVALYQVFPARSDVDILLWSSHIINDPAQPAEIFVSVAQLLNPFRVYLRPSQVYWGLTRPSDYARGKSSQEIDLTLSDHKTYLVVYPFTKTSSWYQLGRDARQGMMNEHIRIGHQFTQITQLLLYSSGIQDQEFTVMYETNDLGMFSALVTELRQSDARVYTLNDTPIYTGVYHPVLDTLNLFT
jgi:chlorite dismutase